MIGFDILDLSFEGASHLDFVGATLLGVPSGIPVDVGLIRDLMARRQSKGAFTTPRKEADKPIFLSGIKDGVTDGNPIHVRIQNTNVKRGDYAFSDTPRPSHADYTARIKYGKDFDMSGGGPFSGRMTAPICALGGVAKAFLAGRNIDVISYVSSVGAMQGESYKNGFDFDLYKSNIDGDLQVVFLQSSRNAKADFEAMLSSVIFSNDSIGGVIECVARGLPAGLGGELDKGLEVKLASAIWTIPAVKGVEFGSGFNISKMVGSQSNDAFAFDENGKVITKTNHAGGLNGGITNGSELTISVAFRPTPTIGKPQETVNLATKENTILEGKGRHDACIALRAPAPVESMVCLALMDEILAEEHARG